MVKESFKFDMGKDQLILDGEDLHVVITFKTDKYQGVVSKSRRLVLENDLRGLYRRVSYENPSFRSGLDTMFGVLLMSMIPATDWKRQADHLL